MTVTLDVTVTSLPGAIMSATSKRQSNFIRARNRPLHWMLIPPMVVVLLFSYYPLFGNIMAFQKFVPAKGILGSRFVGLKNFEYVFSLPNTSQVIFNTFFISLMKIVVLVAVPIVFALLLNEVRNHFTKRAIQTAVYLPHFMSWVIMASILIDILSPSEGIVNKFIMALGFEPIFFLGNETIFPYVMVVTDLLKEFGFESIVFLAALMAIDPTLYEASSIDGANRWQQTWYITLPGISTTIVLIATLSMGYVLNAGFDQIFNLYSPVVASTGEILDTFIYKLGIKDAQYSVATAMGVFRALVSLVFIAVAYKLANKLVGYEIF